MALAVVHSRPSHYPEPFLEIEPSTAPWLVKGVLPASGVAFLVGASKAGKSFLAIDFALRIASGHKVLGCRTKQCGVVYVAAEDALGCRARVIAWRRHFDKNSDAPFDLFGNGVNLLDAAALENWMDAVEESVARFDALGHPLRVIIFDTLSRCLPGVDENSSLGMSSAFTALQRIGMRFGCLVLVLAHFGKAGEERGIRGWSGMDANSDATITVERDSENDDLRTLTLAKVKNGQDGRKIGFRLQDVDLGIIDEDGDTISSCVIAYERAVGVKPKGRRKAMNVPEQMAFTAIRYLHDHGHHQEFPPGIPGVLPNHRAIRRSDIFMQLLGTSFAFDGEKTDSTRKRFDRALMGINAQERVRVEDGLVWLV